MVISIFSGFLGDLAFMPAMLHLFPKLLPPPQVMNETKSGSPLTLIVGENENSNHYDTLKKVASFAAVLMFATTLALPKAMASEADDLLKRGLVKCFEGGSRDAQYTSLNYTITNAGRAELEAT